ncbi:unnamed protein product [Owenia fusiformis]|uniref:TIR domain-containing protein n=1 Tax=Owenia fusiformis TaxID=6347 RepID=A0A8S4NS68_OWEFU|nr:unnamed protein product [Owenia fusiformis]
MMSNASKNQSPNPTGQTPKGKLDRNTPLEENKKILKVSSEEDITAFALELLRHLKSCDTYDNDECLTSLKTISSIYSVCRPHRLAIGTALTVEGLSVQCQKQLKYFNQVGVFKSDLVWFPCYYTMNILWNYSDAVPTLAKALADDGTCKLLLANLSHKPYLENLSSKNVTYMIKASLSIIHNVARTPETGHVFKENKGIEVIKPFTNSDNDFFKALAALTMAYIIDEDDLNTLDANKDSIKFIVNCLRTALQSSTRRFRGFSPGELAMGLNKLAVNDKNKKVIVECGAIKEFVLMLKSNDTEEQHWAARSLWTLAFDKDVRGEIKATDGCIETLEILKSSENSDVKRSALGALWVINEDSQARPKAKEGADFTKKGHIMISYNWDHKAIVRKINDRLKANGYKTWIDVEQMGGSTLEAMAEAVEQASMVLLCFSEKYKDSPNCRTEAEYTFQLRKKTVPIKVQQGYTPNGWLGMMIGTKLFYDFSGKYPFDPKYAELVSQIDKEMGGKAEAVVQEKDTAVDIMDSGFAPTGSSPSTGSATGFRRLRVDLNAAASKWDKTEVLNWLKEKGFERQSVAFDRFDGRMLGRLAGLRGEAPDYFYKSLKREYNLDLLDILKLVDALEEIFPLVD